MKRMSAEDYREMMRTVKTRDQYKYKNQRTQYHGITWDSKLEMQFAQHLESFKKAKQIKFWLRQIPFMLWTADPDEKPIIHRVDFAVFHNDNSVEFIECKGVDHEAGRLKREWVQKDYGTTIRVITKQDIGTWSPDPIQRYAFSRSTGTADVDNQ